MTKKKDERFSGVEGVYASPGNSFHPSYLAYGEYTGGSVGKANLRSWEEMFSDGLGEWWSLERAPYSTRYVSIDVDAEIPKEAFEVLYALSNYPVIDEAMLSEVEMEDQDEAWEHSFRKDFVRALEKMWGIDLDDTEEQEIDSLFERISSKTNTYWEHTDEGAYIDVERVADAVDQKDLEELGFEFED